MFNHRNKLKYCFNVYLDCGLFGRNRASSITSMLTDANAVNVAVWFHNRVTTVAIPMTWIDAAVAIVYIGENVIVIWLSLSECGSNSEYAWEDQGW